MTSGIFQPPTRHPGQRQRSDTLSDGPGRAACSAAIQRCTAGNNPAGGVDVAPLLAGGE
ncbi:hypothetical protein [Mycobacterium lacus]|uniref:hypothetical protein n=1 Tax=Mycobacterium lacus TaxID=169765 RepID=UPI0013D46227|nr:hypothetical protein [Mycobacterium lacus]